MVFNTYFWLCFYSLLLNGNFLNLKCSTLHCVYLSCTVCYCFMFYVIRSVRGLQMQISWSYNLVQCIKWWHLCFNCTWSLLNRDNNYYYKRVAVGRARNFQKPAYHVGITLGPLEWSWSSYFLQSTSDYIFPLNFFLAFTHPKYFHVCYNSSENWSQHESTLPSSSNSTHLSCCFFFLLLRFCWEFFPSCHFKVGLKLFARPIYVLC